MLSKSNLSIRSCRAEFGALWDFTAESLVWTGIVAPVKVTKITVCENGNVDFFATCQVSLQSWFACGSLTCLATRFDADLQTGRPKLLPFLWTLTPETPVDEMYAMAPVIAAFLAAHKPAAVDARHLNQLTDPGVLMVLPQGLANAVAEMSVRHAMLTARRALLSIKYHVPDLTKFIVPCGSIERFLCGILDWNSEMAKLDEKLHAQMAEADTVLKEAAEKMEALAQTVSAQLKRLGDEIQQNHIKRRKVDVQYMLALVGERPQCPLPM